MMNCRKFISFLFILIGSNLSSATFSFLEREPSSSPILIIDDQQGVFVFQPVQSLSVMKKKL